MTPLQGLNVWLGGLFVPEAYITATRQYVAQANNWSLEELSLQVTVSEPGQQVTLDDKSFGVTGNTLITMVTIIILLVCQ